ncbi:hypothetical protein Rs2_50542 [Raphanus sativus]|nr:hypothetical protein Rs2_50542 [Raphanus sativus]
MALIEQILRQGSSTFHSALPCEEIQRNSSVNHSREPTIDVSYATASLLLRSFVHRERRSRLHLSLELSEIRETSPEIGRPLFRLFRRKCMRLFLLSRQLMSPFSFPLSCLRHFPCRQSYPSIHRASWLLFEVLVSLQLVTLLFKTFSHMSLIILSPVLVYLSLLHLELKPPCLASSVAGNFHLELPCYR